MIKIAYQGVAGAYSHIACMKLFPEQEYVACDSFEIAMELVKNGAVDKAVIPVENSNAGRVSDVHFLLPKAGLHIVGEYFMRIEHQLLGVQGATIDDILSASSHPQAFLSCPYPAVLRPFPTWLPQIWILPSFQPAVPA